MAAVLLIFTFFSIAVFGMIALFARAVRVRTPPNERRDLEENSITREEWEWLRRARCEPRRCPRAVGSPARPRGDVVCEICAAVFMERHWRRLVGMPGQEEFAGIAPLTDPGLAVGKGSAPGTATDARRPEILPMLDDHPWERPPDRLLARGLRSRRIVRAGFALALGGASVLALSAALIPGYLMVACGIGMVLRAGLDRGG